MKKIISYFIAIALTLTVAQAALAQEEGEADLTPDWRKDFSVTIGVKVWVNEWQRDSFLSDLIGTPTLENAVFNLGQGLMSEDFGPGSIRTDTSDTRPDTQESDFEPVPIPQVSVKYKKLFVTASYYTETEFDFPIFQRTGSARFITEDGEVPLAERTTIESTTGERREWDAAVGWYLHPYVAVLVGFKEIDQEIKFSFTTTDTFFPDSPFESIQTLSPVTGTNEINIAGPTLGIAGSVPIANGFGIYASYAHGFMDVDIIDFGQPEVDRDADYDVAELGFSYTPNMAALLPHLPLSAATIYAGYRYQTIDSDFDEPVGDRSDVTQGFAAGLNLTW